jgi:hypothetical protein
LKLPRAVYLVAVCDDGPDELEADSDVEELSRQGRVANVARGGGVKMGERDQRFSVRAE